MKYNISYNVNICTILFKKRDRTKDKNRDNDKYMCIKYSVKRSCPKIEMMTLQVKMSFRSLVFRQFTKISLDTSKVSYKNEYKAVRTARKFKLHSSFL